MTKEQIAKLAEFIKYSRTDLLAESIAKWFAKNPQEPVVVGLSAQELQNLFDYLRFHDETFPESHIRHWFASQTFSQPSQKDLDKKDAEIAALKAANKAHVETHIELVGDYEELDKRFAKIGEDRNFFECAARSAEAQVEQLSKMYDDALKELKQLKAQVFQPDWGDAPDDAEEVCITAHWADKDSNIIKSKILFQEQRAIPPAPKVEVGQVWEYKNCEYIVTCCGKLKQGNDWVESVTYFLGGDTYTRTLSDFLAKFEQVQS